MSSHSQTIINQPANAVSKLPLLAAVVALIGLADAVYLTIHHYTATAVPCGESFDCGAVLNSQYAEVGGVPLAIFGAAAYFAAFSLANRRRRPNRTPTASRKRRIIKRR